MRTEQDVKWNPVVGDELEKRTTIRKVERLIDGDGYQKGRGEVRVQCLDLDKYRRFADRSCPSITQFRTWAATAKVVKVKQVETEKDGDGNEKR